MRSLLVVSAWLEAATGFGLMLAPAPLVKILVGAELDTTGGLLIARVAAAALLALGLACWRARNDADRRAARAQVGAMLLYNGAAAGVLVYAGLGLQLSAAGLWPAVLLHVSLAAWCAVSLWPGRVR